MQRESPTRMVAMDIRHADADADVDLVFNMSWNIISLSNLHRMLCYKPTFRLLGRLAYITFVGLYLYAHGFRVYKRWRPAYTRRLLNIIFGS